MWAEIKTALNSTIGTSRFESLDLIQKRKSYECFYNEMISLSKTALFKKDSTDDVTLQTRYDYAPIIIPIKKDGVIDQEYLNIYIDAYDVSGSSYNQIILPPNTIEINNIDEQYCRWIFFIPYGVKRFNSVIGATPYAVSSNKIYEFPSTIEYIRSDAFSKAGSNQKIIIHKKMGEIEGHPWGHSFEDCIIYVGD